jgi:hypothetical protein
MDRWTDPNLLLLLYIPHLAKTRDNPIADSTAKPCYKPSRGQEDKATPRIALIIAAPINLPGEAATECRLRATSPPRAVNFARRDQK